MKVKIHEVIQDVTLEPVGPLTTLTKGLTGFTLHRARHSSAEKLRLRQVILAALATVIGPLMEVPLMLTLVKFGLRTRHLFPRNKRQTPPRRLGGIS
jgi:hypothetical protein